MPRPLREIQEEEQEEARRDAESRQDDALYDADRLDPVEEQRRRLRYESAANEAVGQDLSREEHGRIRALENAQRREARAVAEEQARISDPDAAAAEVRAAQQEEIDEFGRPLGGRRHRRHRKTRKHSRKHTKKNRKVSRRKMTRRRR